MKFVIYNSTTYYPYAEEFDSLEDAIKIFNQLKKDRIEYVSDYNDCYFDKDYLCVVLDECDIEKLKNKHGVKND
jgi:hypothetical protein